jgi:undecaprenyl-diphosphatase
MNLYQSLLLGFIQGLTEFIPISSSAHLALVPFFLKWQINPDVDFIFNVLVQFATLGAVLVYFAKDIYKIIHAFFSAIKDPRRSKEPSFQLGLAVILGTIPLVVFGMPLKHTVSEAFNHPTFIAFALLITAVLLWWTENLLGAAAVSSPPTPSSALIIGLAQLLAVFPGISRSGATISAGLFQKLDRPSAARFSFLLSIPALTGAGLVSLIDLFNLPNTQQILPVILPGMLISFIVGLLSIHWLVKYVNSHSLKIFSVYCLLLSAITLISLYIS